jgi:hypothetical protein
MNKLGIKGTFNLNSQTLRQPGQYLPEGWGQRIERSEVADLYRGHEVAIHTLTHPHLTKVDDAEIRRQVDDDRKALEDIVGYPVRGMAYPFGSFDDRVVGVLKGLDVAYARTCQNAEPCFPVAEPLAWPSTAHHLQPDVPKLWADLHADKSRGGVFYIWGHAYEFDGETNWDALEPLYAPMAGHSDVWYCTNIELFDYEAARKSVVVASNGKSVWNPSGLTVAVKVGGHVVEAKPGGVTPLPG